MTVEQRSREVLTPRGYSVWICDTCTAETEEMIDPWFFAEIVLVPSKDARKMTKRRIDFCGRDCAAKYFATDWQDES